MPWASKYEPVRTVIAHILLVPELRNILCSFDRLIAPLLMLGGGLGRSEYAEISRKLLLLATRKGENEYILPYSNMGPKFEGKRYQDMFILFRVAKRVGKSQTA